MSSSQTKIAIIGSGPAGLTTGLLLHKQGIPFTIYELRQKPTDEELSQPSGMLDLHDESGLAALQECDLLDDFYRLTGECSEAQRVSDKNGKITYEDEGGRDRPEISRHALTKLLIAHVPSDRIKWGYKLLSVHSIEGSGQVELEFESHGKQTFDLVIGADGAWSKVRNLLTEVKPHYGGLQNITLTIREVTKKYPKLEKLVGKGSFSALSSRHGVMSQRGPQDSARIYVFLTTEDEHFANTSGLAGQPATAVKEAILGNGAPLNTWGAALKELVAVAADEETADHPGAAVDMRPMYMLPVGHSWEHKSGATVIGDAAHLMCPWAGEGVNLAMWDSLLLARAIIKADQTARENSLPFQSTLDPLINEFETDMVARAKEKAEETVNNGQMLFGSEDGAKAFTEFFLSIGAPPEHE